MTYKPPLNGEEYWNIVDAYWSDIKKILSIYLPTFSNKWIDGSELDVSLGDYLEKLRKDRNPRIIRAFNAAYWEIPDTKPTNEIPSWCQFYDLCTLESRIYEPHEDTIEE